MSEKEKYTINCLQCKLTGDPKEADITIWTTAHFRVVLRADFSQQRWPWRSVIVYNAGHFSPNELYRPANRELQAELADIQNTLANDVYPALLGTAYRYTNFAQLGNLTRDENKQPPSDLRYHHLYIHAIPQSEGPVHVIDANGKTHVLENDQFGKPLDMSPERFKIVGYIPPQELVVVLVERFRAAIRSL